MTNPVRVIYFGTPAFAVPTLERLAADDRYDIGLVVTQPDRPAGRRRGLRQSAVKETAGRLGLPVYQPVSLRTAESREPLARIGADLFVVAAFGLIFGRSTLALPRRGCINLHASLLPKYRGASPVAAAILAGEDRTGISLMMMDVGLDTGPVLSRAAIDISQENTTETLTTHLAEIAADLTIATLPEFMADRIAPEAQSREGASIVRPLVRADGWLDWFSPADELERRVRAMWPWPRAWTTNRVEALQVHTATVLSGEMEEAPGSVVKVAGRLAVACGDGCLALDLVQPAGSRPMSGEALLAGRRVQPGDTLGVKGSPDPPPPLIRWITVDEPVDQRGSV